MLQLYITLQLRSKNLRKLKSVFQSIEDKRKFGEFAINFQQGRLAHLVSRLCCDSLK